MYQIALQFAAQTRRGLEHREVEEEEEDVGRPGDGRRDEHAGGDKRIDGEAHGALPRLRGVIRPE